jgi:uncharacterized membrane protein
MTVLMGLIYVACVVSAVTLIALGAPAGAVTLMIIGWCGGFSVCYLLDQRIKARA